MNGCGKPCECVSYRAHLASLSFQPNGPHPIDIKDRQWERDNKEYRTLRRQGYQPKTIDGCADLAGKVNSQFEIETSHLFPKEMIPMVLEAQEIAQNIQETGSSDGVVREVAS